MRRPKEGMKRDPPSVQEPCRGGLFYFRGVELRRDEGGVLGLDMGWDTVYIGDVSEPFVERK